MIRDQMDDRTPWRDRVTARNVDAERARDVMSGQRQSPTAPVINPLALQPSQLRALRDFGSTAVQPSQGAAVRDFRTPPAVAAGPVPSAPAATDPTPAAPSYRNRQIPASIARPASQRINPQTNRPFGWRPEDGEPTGPSGRSPALATDVATAQKVQGINQLAADLRPSLGAAPPAPVPAAAAATVQSPTTPIQRTPAPITAPWRKTARPPASPAPATPAAPVAAATAVTSPPVPAPVTPAPVRTAAAPAMPAATFEAPRSEQQAYDAGQQAAEARRRRMAGARQKLGDQNSAAAVPSWLRGTGAGKVLDRLSRPLL